MNIETGKITSLQPGEQAPANHVQISEYERRYLEQFPEAIRPFELAWVRIYKKEKWDIMERLRRKEMFRQGWNSAVYMNAKFYVISDKERKAIDEERKSESKQ